ncbi:hypothetical protein [Nocardioides piscis]|uniref:Chemotaxis methyl-accepting receptor HlyB-like 4HB MCP domain-containing protein n=1 Tax=Nocardioides piscis TaxID=2714938 RepID=A0A6G7YII7_9ACTN|nr:hypothetical protein [Nocardioides piscis]QIK76551.1 hypothetical protein G7071_15115 [Nocardioides piscis]
MTQATQPAPHQAPTVAQAPTTGTQAATASEPAARNVPLLLNQWQVIVVAACLLFAFVTAVLQVLGWQANRAAADNTEQLVRVQNIQSTLFRADALATTSFLVGGLEAPERRQAYDEAIDQVSRQITEAADAQPADQQALAELNAAVNQFTETNTQARDYNRQGFPVGAEYLRGASTQLRGEAQPLLAALTRANSQRAEDELGAQHPLLILLPGAVALALLWWVNVQLSRVFRRRFNVGIAAAFAIVALLTLVTATVSAGQEGDNDDLLAGSYRVAVDEATARTAANDAKSNESLRLGAQGSGAVFEEGWRSANETVESHASDSTLGLWRGYSDLHTRVVDLEESGKYEQAVALATTAAADGPTTLLDEFDRASQEVTARAAKAATDELRGGNVVFLLLAVITVLLGIGAAGLSAWGIAQRRREYA